MRQISPASNLFLACLSALGLVGALRLPWFAPPVEDKTDTDGPVEQTAFAVAHVFRHHDRQLTGTDALGGSHTVVLVLAAAVVVLAVLAGIPALRAYVRDLLRAVALATPVLVVVLAFRSPGTTQTLDLHWGLIVAVAVAAFAASTAWHGSGIRVKRAPAGSWERKPA
jgi:hypothetical protein